MKRIMILTIAAVMLAVAAAPAMAQTSEVGTVGLIFQGQKAAEKKAAREAARAANRAEKMAQAQEAGLLEDLSEEQKQQVKEKMNSDAKALPKTGGMSAGNAALLGAGVLLVGGGLVARRMAR